MKFFLNNTNKLGLKYLELFLFKLGNGRFRCSYKNFKK